MTGAAAKPTPSPYGRTQAAGIALLAALALLLWAEPRLLPRLHEGRLDAYQLLKPRSLGSAPVKVVEIDERSVPRLGRWPWPRNDLADLLRAIERHQPLAIGLDFFMPERDRLSQDWLITGKRMRDPVLGEGLRTLPSNDRELAQAIAAGPVVVGLAAVDARTGKEPSSPPFVVIDRAGRATITDINLPSHAGALTNIAEIDRAAAGHGAIMAGPADNVIRRLPLAIRIDGRLVPALPIEMLRVALGAPEIRLFSRGASIETIAIGDFVAPTEGDGELRIYYSKRDARRLASAVDVLDGKVDSSSLQRNLILVGTSDPTAADYHSTPLGERMPGSEIMAQALENLYDQTWLMRPRWASAVELALFVSLGLLLVWATPRWKPADAALLATFAVALPLVLGFAAFAWWRRVFDAAGPAVGLLVLFSVLLLLTLAEAGRQRRSLERVIQQQREQAAYVAGEVEAAKRVQTGFLPRADALAGDRRVELAADMMPAREVGGDLYDFFPLDGDRLFFMIGDVAGKGLSASMFMAVSKALYKSNALRNARADVGELMRAANAEVSRDNPEMFFVTAFAAVLDLESGQLAYCNAGHDSPYVVGARGAEPDRLAGAGGPPLCTVPGFAYLGAEQRLAAGDVVCLVTDGLTDAQNPRGDRYGSGRLQSALAGLGESERTARGVLDAVSADVQRFAAGAEPPDDLTVLAVRWIGPRAAA